MKKFGYMISYIILNTIGLTRKILKAVRRVQIKKRGCPM